MLLAEKLIAHETLEGEELESVFSETPPKPVKKVTPTPTPVPVEPLAEAKPEAKPKKAPVVPHLVPKQAPSD